MVLYKLDDYYPDYQDEIFDGHDIKNFDVYADDDKVGSVQNMMVDETGHFRYFIVDTGFWVFGKKVLLPVGLVRIDYDDKRVCVPGLTKQQVEDLPEFSEDLSIDEDYEDRVRGIYRPLTTGPMSSPVIGTLTYGYQQEPYFYNLNDPRFRTYEERLGTRRNNYRANVL